MILTPFGIGLTIISYVLLKIVPLTALGISLIVLGLTAASLPKELNASQAMKTLMGSFALTTESTLQELEALGYPLKPIPSENINLSTNVLEKEDDFSGAALYLPPKNGLVTVFLPLCSKIGSSDADSMHAAPRKLSELKDCTTGFVLLPVGAEVGDIMASGDTGEDSLIETLRYVLVNFAQLCSWIKVTDLEDNIVLELGNVKLDVHITTYSKFLGSIPTSLTGCVLATQRQRPIAILDERTIGNRILVRFKIR